MARANRPRRSHRDCSASDSGDRVVIKQLRQERLESRAQIEQIIERACAAAADCEIEAEEQAIAEALEFARRADLAVGWGMARHARKLIKQATEEGSLRRTELLGYAGNVWMYTDRIVVIGEVVHLMDGDVHASVETAGQFSSSSRPTLTRMALGSVLPGSALLVGLATPKTTTYDTRSMYFVVEHPDWAHVVQLDPAVIDEGVMRQVAGAVNRAARALAPRTPTTTAAPPDRLDRLAKLGELRDAGILTPDEFQAEKARILVAE